MMTQPATGRSNIFRQIAYRFFENRIPQSAAALSYITLLTIVPLLAISIEILSVFPIFHAYRFEIQQFVVQNFIPSSGQMIGNYIQEFVNSAGHLSTWGTVFLFITTMMTMFSFEQAFNDIWKVKRRHRDILAWLRYWTLLAIAPIFISVTIAGFSYLVSLPFILKTAQILGLKTLLFKAVPLIFSIILFNMFYVMIPGRHVPIRYGFIGAVMAVVLLDLAKRTFVLYIKHFSDYHLIYGALAIIPLFLIWVYTLWVIILFGALISSVLTLSKEEL